jgi:hypothetical protein
VQAAEEQAGNYDAGRGAERANEQRKQKTTERQLFAQWTKDHNEYRE